MKFKTNSPRKTGGLGALFAKELLSRPPKTHGAIVVALVGDLGSGKTTFIQGFARGAGIRRRLVSPTFTIMRRYGLKTKNFKNLTHVDAYRVNRPAELKIIHFKDWLRDPSTIVLIEWADLVKKSLPEDALWLQFTYGKYPHERSVLFSQQRRK